MGRALAWLGGAFGLAALWRFLRQEQAQQQQADPGSRPEPDVVPDPVPDPAADHVAELRERLEQAREAADDRDAFDAAEGQPVDEVEVPHRDPDAAEPVAEAGPAGPEAEREPPRSLEERRRAIHEKAQQALGEMHRPGPGE